MSAFKIQLAKDGVNREIEGPFHIVCSRENLYALTLELQRVSKQWSQDNVGFGSALIDPNRPPPVPPGPPQPWNKP